MLGLPNNLGIVKESEIVTCKTAFMLFMDKTVGGFDAI
jgi:hypothetical protein